MKICNIYKYVICTLKWRSKDRRGLSLDREDMVKQVSSEIPFLQVLLNRSTIFIHFVNWKIQLLIAFNNCSVLIQQIFVDLPEININPK